MGHRYIQRRPKFTPQISRFATRRSLSTIQRLQWAFTAAEEVKAVLLIGGRGSHDPRPWTYTAGHLHSSRVLFWKNSWRCAMAKVSRRRSRNRSACAWAQPCNNTVRRWHIRLWSCGMPGEGTSDDNKLGYFADEQVKYLCVDFIRGKWIEAFSSKYDMYNYQVLYNHMERYWELKFGWYTGVCSNVLQNLRSVYILQNK